MLYRCPEFIRQLCCLRRKMCSLQNTNGTLIISSNVDLATYTSKKLFLFLFLRGSSGNNPMQMNNPRSSKPPSLSFSMSIGCNMEVLNAAACCNTWPNPPLSLHWCPKTVTKLMTNKGRYPGNNKGIVHMAELGRVYWAEPVGNTTYTYSQEGRWSLYHYTWHHMQGG